VHGFGIHYLLSERFQSISFHFYKRLGDRAMAQVSDEGLFTTVDDSESNSIAIHRETSRGQHALALD
jgi:hypothetical protein